MYKATVIPTNAQIVIPSYYVGKKVEVIVYGVDEINSGSNIVSDTIKKPSDFVGCISKDQAKQMLSNLEQSRSEWNRDI